MTFLDYGGQIILRIDVSDLPCGLIRRVEIDTACLLKVYYERVDLGIIRYGQILFEIIDCVDIETVDLVMFIGYRILAWDKLAPVVIGNGIGGYEFLHFIRLCSLCRV